MSTIQEEELRKGEPKPRNARLHDEYHASFVSRSHLHEVFDLCKKFYTGEQWPEHAPDGMPRPVLNVTQYAINKKASLAADTEIFLDLCPSDNQTDVRLIQEYDEAYRIRMNDAVFRYLTAANCYTYGIAITYCRWDENDEHEMGFKKGGVVEKDIDPNCFAVANPYEPEIDRQKWVMFWTDVEVGAVKEMLKKERWSEKTLARKSDSLKRESGCEHMDETNTSKDIINHALVRVYTRFFKFKGEVFFECSTNDIQITNTPHPLSTDAAAKVAEFRKKIDEEAKKEKKLTEDGLYVEDLPIDLEDVQIGDMPGDDNSESSHKRFKEKFSEYPFSVYRNRPIRNSFYGDSDAFQMITMQKTVNFLIAMLAACAQNNAYGKIIVKEGALRGQKITTTPGQVITDYSKFTNGSGISVLPTPALPNDLINFVSVLLDFWSKYGGFGDILGGTITNQQISGYAYDLASQQANTITAQEQKMLWEWEARRLKIRLQYYRFYLGKDAMFSVALTQGEIEKQENARKRMLANLQMNPNFPLRHEDGTDFSPEERQEANEIARTPVAPYRSKKISREDVSGVDFDVIIEPQQGMVNSKMRTTQIIEQMFSDQSYVNMTPDTKKQRILMRPDIPSRIKRELINFIELEEEGYIAQLRNYLQYAVQLLQQKDATIENLEAMLGRSDTYNKNITKEFNDKINAANKTIKGLANALAMQNSGISEGKAKSNNARGIGGSDIVPPSAQQTELG